MKKHIAPHADSVNRSDPVFKRRIAVGVGAALFVSIVALLLSRGDSIDHHLAELRTLQAELSTYSRSPVRAGFNSYRPSLLDRFRGIQNNEQKLNFHLNRLIGMGAVERRELVFTEVPHTAESSQRLWRLAITSFPEVVDIRAEYLSTNAPGYGVKPYRMEVFDVPQRMRQWDRFLEANNQRQ